MRKLFFVLFFGAMVWTACQPEPKNKTSQITTKTSNLTDEKALLSRISDSLVTFYGKDWLKDTLSEEEIMGEYVYDREMIYCTLNIKKDTFSYFVRTCDYESHDVGGYLYHKGVLKLYFTEFGEKDNNSFNFLATFSKWDNISILSRYQYSFKELEKEYLLFTQSYNSSLTDSNYEYPVYSDFYTKKTAQFIPKTKPQLPKKWKDKLLDKPIYASIIKILTDSTLLIDVGTDEGIAKIEGLYSSKVDYYGDWYYFIPVQMGKKQSVFKVSNYSLYVNLNFENCPISDYLTTQDTLFSYFILP